MRRLILGVAAVAFAAVLLAGAWNALTTIAHYVTHRELVEAELREDLGSIFGVYEPEAAPSPFMSPSSMSEVTTDLAADPEALEALRRFLERKEAFEAAGGDEDRWLDDAEFQQQIATDARSMTASKNLDALAAAEARYRAERGSYLMFNDATEAILDVLDVALPQPVHHRYSARMVGGSLLIEARGDLDGDPFEDLWWGGPANGFSAQLASDALDVDMYPRLPDAE